MAGSVVRLINNSDRDFNGMYASDKYPIPPGREAIVPFEAMCLWLGHPDAVDLGPGKNYRHEEFARLQVRYGAFDERDRDENMITPGDVKWERNKPLLEVWTLEGDRLITVVDDPDGKEKTPATTTLAQNELLAQQMEAMKRQMAEMAAQIASNERNAAAESVAEAAPDAGPVRKPVPGQEPPLGGPTSDPPPEPSAEDVAEDRPTRVRVSR